MELTNFKNLVWSKFVPFATICLFILLGFYAGKCTRSADPDYRGQLDDLSKRLRGAQKGLQMAEKEAAAAYARGVQAQQAKGAGKTVYVQDKAANRKFRKQLRDSIARVILALSPGDSSNFSRAAGVGVLDMDAKIRQLTANDFYDSTAIVNYKQAYELELQACDSCKQMVANKDKVIGIKDAQIKEAKRKPHWWEIPLVALAAIAGFVLGSL